MMRIIFFRVPKALHRFKQPWISCGSYRNWPYQSATYGITLWPINYTILLVVYLLIWWPIECRTLVVDCLLIVHYFFILI